jgi:hypothetical protein
MAKKTRLTVRTRGLARAAHDILRFLAAHDVPACLIGGLAVQRWGEPRATQDVDLTLLAPFGEEAPPIDLVLSRYTPRDANARTFALEYRVLKVRSADGVPIDVSLAALPFELEVLQRASPWRLSPRIHLVVCSAEDLLIYKLVAARPRDLLDVDGIVRLRWRALDVARVRSRTREFATLLETPSLLQPFEVALRTARRSASR